MLPKNSVTPRGLYLQELVNKATPDEMMTWPQVTEADYAAIGKLVVIYTYIDFNFRRMVEDYEMRASCSHHGQGALKNSEYLK